jgi:hypothetical protein
MILEIERNLLWHLQNQRTPANIYCLLGPENLVCRLNPFERFGQCSAEPVQRSKISEKNCGGDAPDSLHLTPLSLGSCWTLRG